MSTVSDSSLATDLQEKSDIYAESGIVEYWVVDMKRARIHVMSQSDGQHYQNIQVVVPPSPLAPQCLPQALLNTAELFEVRPGPDDE